MNGFTPWQSALGALLLVLGWDILVGGRGAQARTNGAVMRALSGLGGFLVAPAWLVAVLGVSATSGQALTTLDWFWPLTVLLVVVQGGVALAQRRVRAVVGVPLLVWNLAQLVVGTTRVLTLRGVAVPTELLAIAATQAGVLSAVLGTAWYASPFALAVPLVTPTTPPRGRTASIARILAASLAIAGVGSLVEGWPSTRAGALAWQRLGDEPTPERASEDFTVGLALLAPLRGWPGATALREDLALADSIRVGTVAITLPLGGAPAAALDSLQRALDGRRRDSTRLVVLLTLGTRDDGAAVERTMRRLRPDVFVFDGDPSEPTVRAVSAIARRLRPATRLALAITRGDAGDSARVAWARASGNVVDELWWRIDAPPGGATALAATLATVERWLPADDTTGLGVWIELRGAPIVDGDEAQRRGVSHVLTWATARADVRGVVYGAAADYDRGIGLRTVRGRWRPAVGDLAAAVRSIDDSPATGGVPP